MNANAATRRRLWAWVALGVLVGLTANRRLVEAGGVPPAVNGLVFHSGQFTAPLAVALPCPDPPSEKSRILNWWRENHNQGLMAGGLAPVGSFRTKNVGHGLLGFLVKHHLAVVEALTDLPTSMGPMTYHFLSYTPEIQQYLAHGSPDATGCREDSLGLLIGVRQLKSVDYTNEYEAAPEGVKVKVFALTFSYEISEKIPDLPSRPTAFRGKAKAYLDPDDGEWKLEHIELTDNGAAGYISAMESAYSGDVPVVELSPYAGRAAGENAEAVASQPTPQATEPPRPLPGLAGTWSGTVAEKDGKTETISLSLVSGSPAVPYTGSYQLATRACGGTLVFEERLPDGLKFRAKHPSKWACGTFFFLLDMMPSPDGLVEFRMWGWSTKTPKFTGTLRREEAK